MPRISSEHQKNEMVEILKGVNFRIVNASGVYVTPTPTELRLFFVAEEPTKGDTGDEKQPAGIQVAPHIQAEIVISRDLARWIRDYLNAYCHKLKHRERIVRLTKHSALYRSFRRCEDDANSL